MIQEVLLLAHTSKDASLCQQWVSFHTTFLYLH